MKLLNLGKYMNQSLYKDNISVMTINLAFNFVSKKQNGAVLLTHVTKMDRIGK